MMNTVMTIVVAIGSLVTAAATVGIFLFTRKTYDLYQMLHKNQKEQEQRFNDLFEGIVIATLLSGPSSYGAYKDCKKQFLQEYKGKTGIFKE